MSAVFAVVDGVLEIHFFELEERQSGQQAVTACLMLRPVSFNLRAII
jgi:hypothetical protein